MRTFDGINDVFSMSSMQGGAIPNTICTIYILYVLVLFLTRYHNMFGFTSKKRCVCVFIFWMSSNVLVKNMGIALWRRVFGHCDYQTKKRKYEISRRKFSKSTGLFIVHIYLKALKNDVPPYFLCIVDGACVKIANNRF